MDQCPHGCYRKGKACKFLFQLLCSGYITCIVVPKLKVDDLRFQNKRTISESEREQIISHCINPRKGKSILLVLHNHFFFQ